MGESTGTATSLSLRTPREVCGVSTRDAQGAPLSSLATLYAAYRGHPGCIVGVRLVAMLNGARHVVAQAGVPLGYSGLVASASGIVADGWAAEAWGALGKGELDLHLGTRECCGGVETIVPAEVQHGIPEIVIGEPASVLPLGRPDGAYRLVAGVDGTEWVHSSERVLRVFARATDGADASFTLLGTGVGIAAGDWVELLPWGNLAGPGAITFTDTKRYTVELVR